MEIGKNMKETMIAATGIVKEGVKGTEKLTGSTLNLANTGVQTTDSAVGLVKEGFDSSKKVLSKGTDVVVASGDTAKNLLSSLDSNVKNLDKITSATTNTAAKFIQKSEEISSTAADSGVTILKKGTEVTSTTADTVNTYVQTIGDQSNSLMRTTLETTNKITSGFGAMIAAPFSKAKEILGNKEEMSTINHRKNLIASVSKELKSDFLKMKTDRLFEFKLVLSTVQKELETVIDIQKSVMCKKGRVWGVRCGDAETQRYKYILRNYASIKTGCITEITQLFTSAETAIIYPNINADGDIKSQFEAYFSEAAKIQNKYLVTILTIFNDTFKKYQNMIKTITSQTDKYIQQKAREQGIDLGEEAVESSPQESAGGRKSKKRAYKKRRSTRKRHTIRKR
jgi:hypothetical protein